MSTVAQIVMIGGKYELWGSLLRQLEGCPFMKKMRENILRSLSLMASMVLGGAFYAKPKSTTTKIFLWSTLDDSIEQEPTLARFKNKIKS